MAIRRHGVVSAEWAVKPGWGRGGGRISAAIIWRSRRRWLIRALRLRERVLGAGHKLGKEVPLNFKQVLKRESWLGQRDQFDERGRVCTWGGGVVRRLDFRSEKDVSDGGHPSVICMVVRHKECVVTTTQEEKGGGKAVDVLRRAVGGLE